MFCKICQLPTNYTNNLCGPCFNLGFRDKTDAGIVVDKLILLEYISKTPMGKEYLMFYQKVFNEK